MRIHGSCHCRNIAFDDVDPSSLCRSPASFDGESTEIRLARRARKWIGDVRFADSLASLASLASVAPTERHA